MRSISVDWSKATEKPDKKQAVEGRFLLDLRSKIDDLEQKLKQKEQKIEKLSKELNGTKEKLSEKEKSICYR